MHDQTQSGTAAVEAASERMLTVEEAAKRMSCSPATAWRLVRFRTVPSVKVGGMRRVRESDLNEYIRGLPAA